MNPIDVIIESLLHHSFVRFLKDQHIDLLSTRLKKYRQEGYDFKLIEAIKGEADDLIRTAVYPGQVSPEQETFSSFIKEEKLAALRLLKFNKAAELTEIENILDLPNQKTTAAPVGIKPYQLVMYYCVLLKGKDLYILVDTNFHQFHWQLKRLIRSLRTK